MHRSFANHLGSIITEYLVTAEGKNKLKSVCPTLCRKKREDFTGVNLVDSINGKCRRKTRSVAKTNSVTTTFSADFVSVDYKNMMD